MFQVPNIQPMYLKFDENMTRNLNKRVPAISIKQPLYCFSEMRIKDMQIKRTFLSVEWTRELYDESGEYLLISRFVDNVDVHITRQGENWSTLNS